MQPHSKVHSPPRIPARGIGGKTLVAMVTNDSTRSLGLPERGRACGLIKASHFILAVEG